MIDVMATAKKIIANVEQVIVGKRRQIILSLVSWFCEGHILLEDVPGVAKTMLARALAKSVGCSFKRVQCTPDLLPTDVTGASIFNQKSSEFEFRRGPIFAQIVLADEINRATPKCQSALLEAMEERQVSADGKTRELPAPFFVIATQNPTEQLGTFPLPESQLDRFLLRITMGYPDRGAELALLRGESRRRMLESLEPIVSAAHLIAMQRRVETVTVSDAVLDYLYRIIDFTRTSELFQVGLSTRAGLGLLRAAQAWALLHEEDRLLPGDIQKVLGPAVGHRLVPLAGRGSSSRIGEEILAKVPVE